MSLYEVLKNSSGLSGNQETALHQYGYNYDSGLSSANIQVYFNPDTKILLFSVKGTNPTKIADIRTDISLGLGNLKATKRYKDAEQQLARATAKYNPSKRILAGYSLGGTIVSYLGSKGRGDQIYTYNKGATIGQKTRSIESGFRTKGDIVSVSSKNSKRVKTLEKTPSALDVFGGSAGSALSSHNLEQLKKNTIDIPSLTPYTPIQFQRAGEPVSTTATSIEGIAE